MLRLIIQTKRKHKKIVKQDIGPTEENEEVDINELCSTDDESGDGQSTSTQNDMDSEVSFEDARATIKPIKLGSTLPKTVEDGVY